MLQIKLEKEREREREREMTKKIKYITTEIRSYEIHRINYVNR